MGVDAIMEDGSNIIGTYLMILHYFLAVFSTGAYHQQQRVAFAVLAMKRIVSILYRRWMDVIVDGRH